MHIGIVNEQFSWILDISGQNLTQREAEKWDLSPAAVIGNGEPKPGAKGAADGALVHFYALCIVQLFELYRQS